MREAPPLRPLVLLLLSLLAAGASDGFAQGSPPLAPARPGPIQAPPRAPVVRLVEIGPAITACWRPPADSEGSELVLRFSLNRWGAVIGKPDITFAKLTGDEPTQKRFVAAVLAALDACTPLPITETFGNIIAGRPFTLRFASRKRATAI